MAALQAAGINDRLMSAANLVCSLPSCDINRTMSICKGPFYHRPIRHPVMHVRDCVSTCLQDPEMQAALGSGDSTREAQLLETWKAYKKGFQQGIALFNLKPKKGIAYLQVCLSLRSVFRGSFPSMAFSGSHVSDGPCAHYQDTRT